MDAIKYNGLGQTGLQVGRLGVAASYGAPASAFEEAFDHGCNYFYWGSQRRSGMRRALQNICSNGKRDEVVILIQSYSRGEKPLSATDCYRFVLSNPAVNVCMCGPKDVPQMREALKSLELGPMDEEELERVRRIGDHVHAHSGKFF
ncbi:MAG: hypothetical protein JRF72_11255 [Deltaproteobacteria bacterium]|jgi:aryl-alcohol dehydrogenase-like predicted oxidoreductase|nr:hypothetical protein [Deltaproteobacteria bacterium]